MDLQESGLLERDYQITDILWKYILLCAYICYARNEETQGEKTSRGSVSTILYLPSHPISKDRSTDNACCKTFTIVAAQHTIVEQNLECSYTSVSYHPTDTERY